MFEGERRSRILRELENAAFASVADLVSLTGASEATIRRDLEKMHSAGLLRRIRGGAQAASHGTPPSETALSESPLSARSIEYRANKERIARYAVSLCSDDDLIFVDGGSTTLLMAPGLREVRLQVVTNSFALAGALAGARAGARANDPPGTRNDASPARCTVFLPGGMLYADSGLVLDPFESGFFSNFEADIAFFGAGAISLKGVENRDMRVIREERQMLAHARKRVVLADSSKFTRTGSILLCGLEDIDLIVTDHGMPKDTREEFASTHTDIALV